MLVQNQAPEGEAQIEQIFPSSSTYQRKHKKTHKHKRAKKVTKLPQTSVPLDLGADEAVHKEGVTEIGLDDRPRRQETTLGGADAQPRFETASKKSRDPPLSKVNTSRNREDRMEHLDDLMDFVPPTPHDSPLSRGSTNYSRQSDYQIKIESQEARKKKARTSQLMKRRLFKGRVETPTDKSLDEDASKQGRIDDKIEELNLTDGADTKVIIEDKGSCEKCGSTADQVSTARPEVCTARVPVNVSAATPSTRPKTTTIFGDKDLTIAQTLIKLRSEKAKLKGVAFREVEEPPRLTRSTITLQPLPTIDPKDKGKGVLVEEEPEKLEKVKRRDQGLAQIKSDTDLAQRIYKEELAELDRAQKEKQKQEKATIAALTKEFDEIQA
nr:hypothetical protein [Tanacetum cinerariifolium]